MSWKPAPIIGGAYSDDAKAWSCQDTVNWIPVAAERSGSRTPTMLRGAPGMRTFCITGSGQPIRGVHNVEGLLLVVSGTTLYRVSTLGAATALGTIPGVERVSMAHNQITGGSEVAIANGQGGYVYNTVTGTLTQITDDGFPGAISFDFCDGYIMGVEPGRRFAFHSQLAAAGDYNTLDRYEAEGSPDKLVGQIVTHREWWLFGERTIEPYVNTGEATGTFQRSSGTVIEVGAASRNAIVQMDNSVFWLGNDGVVYRANGYAPQRISTHAIEQAISRCNLAQAFAFTFEDRGHKIFYLTFPDGMTWGYDAASGEWHRRKSDGLDRWRINTLTRWNGHWIAGDYTNGKLYELNWDVQDEDGAVLERRRVTGVLSDNQNRVTVDGVALVFDTGTTTEPKLLLPPLSLSGHLPNGPIGEVVSYQYAVGGGVLPRTVAIASGALPAGLTMSSAGLITGTRTTLGSYAWTVRVTDADGSTADLADTSVTRKIRVAYFDGVGDYLSAPFAPPILATGDFTVQFRVSPSATKNHGIVSGRNSSIRGWAAQINIDSTTGWRQSMNGGLIDSGQNVPGAGSVPINALTHVAITRKGNLFTVWISGSAVSSTTQSGSIDEPAVTSLIVGSSYAATLENMLSGYLDWLTINIGTCLYDATFTPPAGAEQVPDPQVRLAFDEAIGSKTFADTGSLGLTWETIGDVVIVEYPY